MGKENCFTNKDKLMFSISSCKDFFLFKHKVFVWMKRNKICEKFLFLANILKIFLGEHKKIIK